MSIYSMDHLDANTIFRQDVPRWHNKGTDYPEITAPILTELMTRWQPFTAEPVFTVELPDGKKLTVPVQEGDKGIIAIHRDTQEAQYVGVKGSNYVVHDLEEWLVKPALEIVQGVKTAGAQILSAINLGYGSHVATTISLKGTKILNGVEYRPYLSFITGHKMSTMVVRGNIVVVCDNTAEQAANEGIRIKHTKNSLERLDTDYAATIERFVENAEAAEPLWIGMLGGIEMSEADFADILDRWTPIPQGVTDSTTSKRTKAMRENIRAEIFQMLENDPRCTPFKGTLMSAYQALSTHDHFYSRTRGNGIVTDREELVLSKHTMDRYFPTFPTVKTDKKSIHDAVMHTIVGALDKPQLKQLIAA